MNFKQSLKSFSTVGTLGIILGTSLAVPVQAAQVGLSQQKTSNSPNLIAQNVRNLRQRQQRNRQQLIQRQQNIRQNFRQRQQNYLQRLREQGGSPGVIQDRRQRQRESLQNLRERQRANLREQRQRQQDLLRQRALENRLNRRFTLVVQKTLKRLEGLEDSHFSEFNVGVESFFLLERSTSRGRIVSG